MWIITGATGFIGSALAWELNEHGLNDLVVSDFVPPTERPGLLRKRKFTEFVPAAELFTFLENAPVVNGIFHMGACSTTTETDESCLSQNRRAHMVITGRANVG